MDLRVFISYSKEQPTGSQGFSFYSKEYQRISGFFILSKEEPTGSQFFFYLIQRNSHRDLRVFHLIQRNRQTTTLETKERRRTEVGGGGEGGEEVTTQIRIQTNNLISSLTHQVMPLPFDPVILCSSVNGSNTSIYCVYVKHFQFPCHLGDHIPSLRIDLVCGVFLVCPKNAMAASTWDFFFLMCTLVFMHAIAHWVCTDTVRACTES